MRIWESASPPRRAGRASCRSNGREVAELGKFLLCLGLVMIVLGGILLLAGNSAGKVPWLGRLPGDISIERGNWRLYFPLGTSILVSVVLSLLVWLFSRR